MIIIQILFFFKYLVIIIIIIINKIETKPVFFNTIIPYGILFVYNKKKKILHYIFINI